MEPGVVLLAAGLLALAAGLCLAAAWRSAGRGRFARRLMLARFFAKAEMPCLSITSTDGHKHQFTGQRRTLDEARRILTDKINTGDENAVFRVSFEKGIIQPRRACRGRRRHAGGRRPPGPAGAADTRMTPWTLTCPRWPSRAPARRRPPCRGVPHVDYSQVLPQIVDMQRFYAQRQDTQDIAERLNELEYLMRSGTPTAGSRSRLNHLAGELGSILGAYPGVVQIFQQAARLAGF